MQPYFNRSGESGVIAYEVGADSITVRFKDGTYLYNSDRPGRMHVEQMKRLAMAGRGLATYISKFVRDNYARKIE
jgi:hypothetical protein